ncbi:hypothetical protein G6F24_012394 [Rhizopus arrhizus]|nr:hypothetical protein G6F24_012394 [Rhizopus arrhizus]
MAAVRPRVHGDAMRAGIQAGLGGPHHVRFGAATRVAQDGDLVDVDAELGHGTELLGKRGRIVVVAVVVAAGLGLFAQAPQFLGIDQGGRVALQVAQAGHVAAAYPGQQEGEGSQQAQGHQPGAGGLQRKGETAQRQQQVQPVHSRAPRMIGAV